MTWHSHLPPQLPTSLASQDSPLSSLYLPTPTNYQLARTTTPCISTMHTLLSQPQLQAILSALLLSALSRETAAQQHNNKHTLHLADPFATTHTNNDQQTSQHSLLTTRHPLFNDLFSPGHTHLDSNTGNTHGHRIVIVNTPIARSTAEAIAQVRGFAGALMRHLI